MQQDGGKTEVEEVFTGFHTGSETEKQDDEMIIDSGANISITNDKTALQDFQEFGRYTTVMASNGGTLQAIGKGTMILSVEPKIAIPNMLYVPKITKTLISTNCITNQGYEIHIKGDLTVSTPEGKPVLKAKNRNGLYYLTRPNKEANSVTAISKINLQQAHRRFGHACNERLSKLQESCEGIELKMSERPKCNGCALGQARRQPFPEERRTKPTRKFEIVSSDLKGPLLSTSQGYQYYITFNCLFSKWCWVTFLKTKSPEEVKESLARFLTDAKAETKERMNILLTDNGGEYVNKEMSEFLLIKSIKHQRTVPYSPQQNGAAERRNLTIMNMARTILIDAALPPEFWTFAVRYAVYTQNLLPTRAINWKTPYELWTGEKPDVRHLRIFGCTAYSHINPSVRTSLDPTAEAGIFLGYSQYSKGFIFMRQADQKVLVRRDLEFDESSIPRTPKDQNQNNENDPLETSTEQYSTYQAYVSDIPTTFEEAMNSPESANWLQAAKIEMQAHKDNATWTLIDPPKNCKPIKGKWVFTKKTMNDKLTFKARFVARGFTQKLGIDYEETFSSVLTYTSLRFIISIAGSEHWKMYHKDFRTAYLNAYLTEPILMYQPTGFVQQGAEQKVCILNKAIYGLKQAGRAWQITLFKTLTQNGLQQSKNEPCIWFQESKKKFIMIGVYVDDLIVTGNDEEKMKYISETLHKNYKMKDLGQVKKFLGIEITKFKNKISLTQKSYIHETIKKFRQENCKPEPTPTIGGDMSDGNIAENNLPIREALGALMFIANATRPDISYIVNKLSRHVSTPTAQLWKGIQRVLKYLKGTEGFGLTYDCGRPRDNLIFYADSSFADDATDRKSTTGWISLMGGNVISWRSVKQKSVALSTTESEYMACCDATKEAVWIRNLYQEIFGIMSKPVTIFQDNQSTIFLAKNDVVKRRTKHIDLRYHFVREQIQKGIIEIIFCDTENMTADILTKPLGKHSYQRLRDKIVSAISSDSGHVDLEGAYQTSDLNLSVSPTW